MHNPTGSVTLKPRTLQSRWLGRQANSRFVVQHTPHRTGDELWSSIQCYVNFTKTGYEQVSNEHLLTTSIQQKLQKSEAFDLH